MFINFLLAGFIAAFCLCMIMIFYHMNKAEKIIQNYLEKDKVNDRTKTL